MSLRNLCGKFKKIKEAEIDPEDFRAQAEAIIADKARNAKLEELEKAILKIIGNPYYDSSTAALYVDYRLDMYQREKSHGYKKAVARMAEAILDEKL